MTGKASSKRQKRLERYQKTRGCDDLDALADIEQAGVEPVDLLGVVPVPRRDTLMRHATRNPLLLNRSTNMGLTPLQSRVVIRLLYGILVRINRLAAKQLSLGSFGLL